MIPWISLALPEPGYWTVDLHGDRSCADLRPTHIHCWSTTKDALSKNRMFYYAKLRISAASRRLG